MNINFEFDPEKDAANLAKHGLSFKEAQELWQDPNLLEIPAKEMDEPRTLIIGKIAGRHWAAIVTHRPPNIRIISVRRARDKEIDLYETA